MVRRGTAFDNRLNKQTLQAMDFSPKFAPPICYSNASTVSSSCSIPQVSKADISKQEFELRKRQM